MFDSQLKLQCEHIHGNARVTFVTFSCGLVLDDRMGRRARFRAVVASANAPLSHCRCLGDLGQLTAATTPPERQRGQPRIVEPSASLSPPGTP